MLQLDLFSDLSERIPYQKPWFPLFIGVGNMKKFKKFECSPHWHQDIEITLILSGEMTYNVNNQAFIAKAGDALFINSKRLHYHFSSDKQDCKYLVLTINPSVIGAELEPVKVYFEEKFGINGDDFIIMSEDSNMKKEITNICWDIYNEFEKYKPDYFKLLYLSSNLSSIISEHITYKETDLKDNANRIKILKMTGFIHENYDMDISVDDIMKAGDIGRSQCFDLFNVTLGQTPINYLSNYRVQKSCELLKNINLTVSEIALSCGYSSPSYFTQVFRKITKLTPKEYRSLYGAID